MPDRKFTRLTFTVEVRTTRCRYLREIFPTVYPSGNTDLCKELPTFFFLFHEIAARSEVRAYNIL